MLKKALLLSFLLLSMSALAQTKTIYTQPSIAPCNVSDWICNQMPLGGLASYQVDSGSSDISVGTGFHFYDNNGTRHDGQVTKVDAQPPLTPLPLTCQNGTFCSEGPLQFEISTTDGYTGTVSGTAKVQKVCGRYCWPRPWITAGTTLTTVTQ